MGNRVKVSDVCTKLVSKKEKKGLNGNLEFDCINRYELFKIFILMKCYISQHINEHIFIIPNKDKIDFF